MKTEDEAIESVVADLVSKMSDHSIQLLIKALALASAREANNGNG